MMMTRDVLRRLLNNGYGDSRFHSFLGSLSGLSEPDAGALPAPYKGYPHMTGTILNLIYHTAGDKFVIISTGFGDGSIGWPEMERRWNELGGGLSGALKFAEQAHEHVLQTLDSWDETRLEESRPYYNNKRYPAHRLFEIMAEHDIYHAGQIRYIRNLLAAEKSD